MKAKHFCISAILLLFINFSQSGIVRAASDSMPNKFKFYDIGAEDTKDAAAKKLAANGFKCLQGKATYFHIREVQKQSVRKKTTEKIEELVAIDEHLKSYGKVQSIEDMPVDILGCSPPEDSPFGFSTFFFSTFDRKALAIGIEVKSFDLLKDKLTSKFGSCISEGYCELGDSILILAKIRGLHLKVYFYENLKAHYNKIKELKAQEEKIIRKQLDDAF